MRNRELQLRAARSRELEELELERLERLLELELRARRLSRLASARGGGSSARALLAESIAAACTLDSRVCKNFKI